MKLQSKYKNYYILSPTLPKLFVNNPRVTIQLLDDTNHKNG
jgi:hypothetical protein